MTDPAVDVIIAVHLPTRPVERAVASVLDHTQADVRVTVVVHNIDEGLIRARLSTRLDDSRLRVVSFADGMAVPAGPKNRGLDLATAPYVAMLDSDDTLEPGALDAWLQASRLPDGPADVVIAPTAEADLLSTQPSPPIRWHQARGSAVRVLDPIRDRLIYRSSPLGLIGRHRFSDLRFAVGVPTGEDQVLTAGMWFMPGARIVFPIRAPRYLEHADQQDRVTDAPRPISQEFRSLEDTMNPVRPWNQDPRARLSFLVKFVRVHYFDAVQARIDTAWDVDVAESMAAVGRRLIDFEPRLVWFLSRVDEALFEGLLDPVTPVHRLRELLAARNRIRSADALLTRRLKYSLHRQGPLRTQLAGAILLRMMNRCQ